ncbi:hypothetical protein DFH09DRAFT_1323729 [Mycena vulgaris]|nr:hypothetical protein DFH09DRAFT_1323729 [Mycena vulgaris]
MAGKVPHGRPRKTPKPIEESPAVPDSQEREEESPPFVDKADKPFKPPRGVSTARTLLKTRVKGRAEMEEQEGLQDGGEEKEDLGEAFSPENNEKVRLTEECDKRFEEDDDSDSQEELVFPEEDNQRPSSPSTQHHERARRKSALLPKPKPKPARSASREKGKGPCICRREPTTANPQTPKPPPKKAKKGPKAISLAEADDTLASAKAPKTKPRRRVSFSTPGPQFESSPRTQMGDSPYDQHFPLLSSLSSYRHGTSPSMLATPSHNGDQDSEEGSIDFNPSTGKITLLCEQLAKLLKSASATNMEKLTRPRDDSGIGYSAVVKMSGVISPKVPRVIDIKADHVISPHRLAIPLHVKKSLQGRWKTYFPLSDLTAENCSHANKERDSRNKKQLVFENSEMVAKDFDHDNSSDLNLNPAEFVTVAEHLTMAIRQFFVPKKESLLLSQQVTAHFKNIAARSDFLKNFRRYRAYNTEVTKAFVEEPTFNFSRWQSDIYEEVVSRDRDEAIRAVLRVEGRKRPRQCSTSPPEKGSYQTQQWNRSPYHRHQFWGDSPPNQTAETKSKPKNKGPA